MVMTKVMIMVTTKTVKMTYKNEDGNDNDEKIFLENEN